MYTWLGASLAWLLGTALQLMSEEPSRQGCALALLAGLACWLGALAWRMWGCAWFRERAHAQRWAPVLGVAPSVAPALLALGLFSVAWGLTGWRALDRLAQAWPAQWAQQKVQADVRWTGLPQRLAGSGESVRWQVDARIERWLDLPDLTAQQGLPQRVQLWWTRSAAEGPPRPGELWRVTMQLRPPNDLANPGVGDGALGRFARGVRAAGPVESASLQAAQGPWGLTSGLDAIDAWRQRVRDRIFARLSEPRFAGVIAGLAVGDQASIDRADWLVLQRTGTAHLVSISGAHVALLGLLVAWGVRWAWARLPRLVRHAPAHSVAAWAALGVSTLYALGAGWGVPAQRTVWMMAFVTVLGAVGRRWPWPLVWLIAASLVALSDPWALALPGFWLSFVAVGALLASGLQVPEVAPEQWADGRLWARWFARWREGAIQLLRTQRLVAVALAPLALVCFQQTSLVGVLINVLAVPLFTLVFTPLALAGVLVPGCWDAAAWGLQITWGLLGWAAQVPAAVWTVPALPAWVAACGVAAALVLALPGRWRWRVLALPFLLPFLHLPNAWHLLPRPLPGQFSVVVLDVGQGGATLVRTTHHTLLFDAGPLRPDGSNLAGRVILPMLQSLGVSRLDALVVSHDDADHSGGAASVLDGIEVGELLTPFDADHPLLQKAVLHRACASGLSWRWDGVLFRLLHPGEGDEGDDNARSCVLQVQAESAQPGAPGTEPVRLLLSADIEAAQERALLARWPEQVLRSTVMLVPHHGSRTSSTPEWLAVVAPQQAVVQVGERNAYGHPSPAVMRRYAQAGIPVVSTPACGAFVWESADAVARSVPLNVQAAASPGALGRPVLGHCWRATRTRHWQ